MTNRKLANDRSRTEVAAIWWLEVSPNLLQSRITGVAEKSDVPVHALSQL
jgi:hypothetical protein